MSATLAADRDATAFAQLLPQPADALLALIGMHRQDARPGKLDLGVGVYRDETGATPVMAAIKAAEQRLAGEQVTKAYLGAEGDAGYTASLARLALGTELASSDRITGVQTPGGTGALRLGAELIARAGRRPRVWLGSPTWPNHGPIFREAGLEVATHPYFDVATSSIDFAAMMLALQDAAAGDIILIHGCCHNPSGGDLDAGQWQFLTDFIVARGLVPFVDLAYQGLGDGLEEDAQGARNLIAAVPEALLAYSCDKNFALYRERVGALWVQADHPASVAPVRDNMLVLARSLWSMPPDHGAASVRIVLDDDDLAAIWRDELDAMRGRLNGLRRALAAAHPRLAPIAGQRGLFAILPIGVQAVVAMRNDHGIYMAGSGRINIAGLTEETIPHLVAAISHHL